MRPFIPLSASSCLPIASLSLRLSPAERKRGHRFPTSERRDETGRGKERARESLRSRRGGSKDDESEAASAKDTPQKEGRIENKRRNLFLRGERRESKKTQCCEPEQTGN